MGKVRRILRSIFKSRKSRSKAVTTAIIETPATMPPRAQATSIISFSAPAPDESRSTDSDRCTTCTTPTPLASPEITLPSPTNTVSMLALACEVVLARTPKYEADLAILEFVERLPLQELSMIGSDEWTVSEGEPLARTPSPKTSKRNREETGEGIGRGLEHHRTEDQRVAVADTPARASATTSPKGPLTDPQLLPDGDTTIIGSPKGEEPHSGAALIDALDLTNTKPPPKNTNASSPFFIATTPCHSTIGIAFSTFPVLSVKPPTNGVPPAPLMSDEEFLALPEYVDVEDDPRYNAKFVRPKVHYPSIATLVPKKEAKKLESSSSFSTLDGKWGVNAGETKEETEEFGISPSLSSSTSSFSTLDGKWGLNVAQPEGLYKSRLKRQLETEQREEGGRPTKIPRLSSSVSSYFTLDGEGGITLGHAKQMGKNAGDWEMTRQNMVMKTMAVRDMETRATSDSSAERGDAVEAEVLGFDAMKQGLMLGFYLSGSTKRRLQEEGAPLGVGWDGYGDEIF